MSRQVVNDSNEIETISVYRIKLKSNVKVWQLFHNRAEIMNARWPSAQWIYDGVFNKDRWGNGYTNYSDVEGTINDYVNGEIVDIPGNNNLYEFVQKQKTIDPSFDVAGSLINMNVDEKKSYTKLINSSIIDDNNNLIRLTYNPVESWSTKNHYYYLEVIN